MRITRRIRGVVLEEETFETIRGVVDHRHWERRAREKGATTVVDSTYV